MVRIRAARAVDMPGMATVLQDAFSEKFGVIFGNKPDIVHDLLETIYSGPVQRGYDGVLVAERDGRVVGTLVIGPVYHTEAENRAFENVAVRKLGLPRMLWAAFLMWLLSHTPQQNEAHITDVGVAPDYQGEGIGARLVAQAERWAHAHQRTRLTLWVAATNERAIRLYEKAGFTVAHTRSNWLLRWTFGIRRWHFMEKRLASSLPALPPPPAETAGKGPLPDR